VSARSARADDDAPPPRPRGGMMDNPLMQKVRLLAAEKVQKELDLSDDQKSSLKKIADDFRDARRSFRDLSADERKTKMQEFEKKFDDVLNDKQRERIKQVGLQLGGVQAWMRKEVADELKLTDEQKTKLQDLQKEQRKQIREQFADGPPDADGRAKIK